MTDQSAMRSSMTCRGAAAVFSLHCSRQPPWARCEGKARAERALASLPCRYQPMWRKPGQFGIWHWSNPQRDAYHALIRSLLEVTLEELQELRIPILLLVDKDGAGGGKVCSTSVCCGPARQYHSSHHSRHAHAGANATEKEGAEYPRRSASDRLYACKPGPP